MVWLSRVLRMQVPLPQFDKSRFFRRFNMMEMDRARFYYWNLFSIAVTALPLAYMATANYRFCEESLLLSERSRGAVSNEVDRGLFNSEKLAR
ncbi:transmembrane protein [Cystoisospora suis]|uniref:Transmembrane protein n=1 Tax=Cystoisospora suis TaxID=483139 RepID=A0A2C6KLN6_9APIC|nr:transmembrane protein [Cystoisospora suis]